MRSRKARVCVGESKESALIVSTKRKMGAVVLGVAAPDASLDEEADNSADDKVRLRLLGVKDRSPRIRASSGDCAVPRFLLMRKMETGESLDMVACKGS